MTAVGIVHLEPGRVDLKAVAVGAPDSGELKVRALCSAISAGSESLIFGGRLPEPSLDDVRLDPFLEAQGYPMASGYALVGEVLASGDEADQSLIGRHVFVFHSHQSELLVSTDRCYLLPEGMPSERAVFLATMETALSLVMDAAPLLGERGMVFGQGVVGLLVVALLEQYPLKGLLAADSLAFRRAWSKRLGAGIVIDASKDRDLKFLEDGLFEKGQNGLDFVVEVSGRMNALNQAIKLTGFDGRIVIGSWYGKSQEVLDLGGSFHRRRIRLMSSQVSTLGPPLTGRWDKARRLALALEWLDRLMPERLITHRFKLSACQLAFETTADSAAESLQVIFEY